MLPHLSFVRILVFAPNVSHCIWKILEKCWCYLVANFYLQALFSHKITITHKAYMIFPLNILYLPSKYWKWSHFIGIWKYQEGCKGILKINCLLQTKFVPQILLENKVLKKAFVHFVSRISWCCNLLFTGS